jgi:hypothetical protein
MKNILIFEDGKGARGSRAVLVKRGNKRVLITFGKYDHVIGKDVVVTEWFRLFIPSYVSNKKNHKHNNARKKADYIHVETNKSYNDENQTQAYKSALQENFSAAYIQELFSEEQPLHSKVKADDTSPFEAGELYEHREDIEARLEIIDDLLDDTSWQNQTALKEEQNALEDELNERDKAEDAQTAELNANRYG